MSGKAARPGRRAWLAVLVVGLPLALLLTWMDDRTALLGRFVLVTAGPAGILVGLRWHRPRNPRPWVLILAGLLALQAGDIAVFAAVRGGADPTNVPLDSWLSALGTLLFVGGAVDASRAVRGRDLGGTLDAVVGGLAVAMILWQVLVVPAAAPGWAGSGLELAGSVQVIALSAIGALVVRTVSVLPTGERISVVLIALAVALGLVGFIIGAIRDAADVAAHYAGLRATTGASGTLLVSAAALHPQMGALTRRVPPPVDELTMARLLGYGVAMLTPILVLANVILRDQPVAWETLILGWLLLVPTVLARFRMLARSRADALDRAAASEQRLAAMLAHTGDVLLLVSAAGPTRGQIAYASPAVEGRLGRRPRELLGADAAVLVVEEDRQAFAALLDDTAALPRSGDVRLARPDGVEAWFDAVVDRGPQVTGLGRTWVVTLRDVTDRKRAEQAWVTAAMHDPLTDLPNRRGVELLLARRLSTHAPVLGVLLCDLDGFKSVNDTYGHAVGDEVLVHLARRLQRIVRDRDIVGRLGGDEFVLACPGSTDPADLGMVADRLMRTVAEPVVVDGTAHHLGVSVGVAVGEGPTCSLHALLREADAALYRAKAAGRGQVQWAPTDGVDAKPDETPSGYRR